MNLGDGKLKLDLYRLVQSVPNHSTVTPCLSLMLECLFAYHLFFSCFVVFGYRVKPENKTAKRLLFE